MNLINIKCRCGKTSLNFQKNIGPFYIDDCCTAAGYDHLGNLTGVETPAVIPEMSPVQNNPYAPAIPELTVEDLTADVKSPEEKKKRSYNRSGKFKPQL